MSSLDELADLRLRLLQNGYRPVPISSPHLGGASAGKRPVLANWQIRCLSADTDEIIRWSQKYPQATNTGILCGEIVCVDIDIPNEALSTDIEICARAVLGITPLKRIGQFPKLALIYRTALPFRKWQTEEFHFVDGTVGRVEILAKGQQFVAFGIHPRTMAEYYWPATSPIQVPDAELPLINEEMVRSFMGAVEKVLHNAGGMGDKEIDVLEREGRKAARLSPGGAPSKDLVEEALRYLPNNDLPYDKWYRVGLSIHAGLGEEGRDLWEQWSATSAKNDPAITSAKYSSFSDVHTITVGTLFYLAKQNGWRRTKSTRKTGIDQADDERPTIHIRGGRQPQEIDLAETALIAANYGVYQRAGFVVRPAHRPIQVANGRVVTAHVLVESRAPHLRDLMTRAILWLKYDKRSEGWVKVNCPKDIPEGYLAREGHWALPVITRLFNRPTLRLDGSILDQPGYDQETGFLFDPEEQEYGAIPASPTQADALDSLAVLDALLFEFPFSAPVDRSVALSGILTAMIRSSIPTAPMHGVTAPVAGSGKSFYVDIVSTIDTGHAAAVIAQGSNLEEMEKRLGAALLAGHSIISFDNCQRPLEGELLCQALTQSRLKIRPLGHSKLVEMPSDAPFFATGNNLVMSDDLGRRTLLCTLDPKVERPELRDFTSNPLRLIRKDRAKYVVAALTILRAYHLAGRPDPPPPLASFEEWSNWVRGALLWLGCADPCDTIETVRASDPKLETQRLLLEQWEKVVGTRRICIRELSSLADIHPDLYDALAAIVGEEDLHNTKRLGMYLSALNGRIIGGRKISRDSQINGIRYWKLVKMPAATSKAA